MGNGHHGSNHGHFDAACVDNDGVMGSIACNLRQALDYRQYGQGQDDDLATGEHGLKIH